jgi:hypothetical protein
MRDQPVAAPGPVRDAALPLLAVVVLVLAAVAVQPPG